MGDLELARAKEGMDALRALPIDICDQSGLKPMQIAALARQMVKDGALAIFLDFVQIIREDGSDRREAINRVSASLRDTCKALNKPFIVASQLARRDANPNRRPTLQDLRESGNLEQDCHNAFFLFRPKDDRGDWNGQDENHHRETARRVHWHCSGEVRRQDVDIQREAVMEDITKAATDGTSKGIGHGTCGEPII